jgi:hypothetical protein
MLGVTLFGIFLTPVFFVAVNWMSETRLLSAQNARQGGRFLIELLTLGLRRVVGMVSQNGKPIPVPDLDLASRARAPARARSDADTGNENADGQGHAKADTRHGHAHGNIGHEVKD